MLCECINDDGFEGKDGEGGACPERSWTQLFSGAVTLESGCWQRAGRLGKTPGRCWLAEKTVLGDWNGI